MLPGSLGQGGVGQDKFLKGFIGADGGTDGDKVSEVKIAEGSSFTFTGTLTGDKIDGKMTANASGRQAAAAGGP